MNVLGIDPGTDLCGWGVVNILQHACRHLGHGCMTHELENEADINFYLFEYTCWLIDEFKIKAVAIEQLFQPSFQSNRFIKIAQARGAILAAIGFKKVRFFSLMPTEIKSAVTGQSTASKKEVQEAVKLILGLSELPRPDDAADGLAAAITLYRKIG